MKEQSKNYESKERKKTSYLMGKTTEELSTVPKWHEFDGEHYGLCARCKEHADFEYEDL